MCIYRLKAYIGLNVNFRVKIYEIFHIKHMGLFNPCFFFVVTSKPTKKSNGVFSQLLEIQLCLHTPLNHLIRRPVFN